MTITTMPGAVTRAHGDPLTEALELTKRLKLPHMRKALTDLGRVAKR